VGSGLVKQNSPRACVEGERLEVGIVPRGQKGNIPNTPNVLRGAHLVLISKQQRINVADQGCCAGYFSYPSFLSRYKNPNLIKILPF
jgi:hypothetical protein